MVLGYSNPAKAIRDHVDDEDKRGERFVHPQGGTQNTTFINESGLYAFRTLPEKGVAFCDSLGGKQKMTYISEFGLYALMRSANANTY